MFVFQKNFFLICLTMGAFSISSYGQSCEGLFPNSKLPSEQSHQDQTRSWMKQILGMNLLPDVSESESQSIDFSWRLVRRKALSREEKNGVLSGDGLYFFTQPQSLDLIKSESRLLDVRSQAWATIDHDFGNINPSAFIQNGGLLWSRNIATQPEDRFLLQKNNVFHVKWYNTNGTLKTAQRFTFPVQMVLQIASEQSWVIVPEKNFDFLTELLKVHKSEQKISEFLSQPILVYGQTSDKKDFRFSLEDSQHFSSGDDLLSASALWTTGPTMIVRATSSLAQSLSNAALKETASPENDLSENEIYIWSARNGKKLIHLSKNAFLKSHIIEPLLSVSLSPEESVLACIFKNHIRFFHLPSESWMETIPWDGVSPLGRWNPDGSIFLAQDTYHFLKLEKIHSQNPTSSKNGSFLLQTLPKKNYAHNGFSLNQPIQWLNDRVFVSHPNENQKTIAVDIQTGDSLNHIFKNLPGLIFNNSNIAYRVILPEGSLSYLLEVYQKVSQQPK